MKPQIKISEVVIKKFSEAKCPGIGKLYGHINDNIVLILGLQLEVENGFNLKYSFPAEVDFCGIFEVHDGNIQEEQISRLSREIDVTDNPVFISVKLSSKNEIIASNVCNEQLIRNEYLTIGEADISSQYIHVRVQGALSLKCEISEKFIEDAFQDLRKTVASGVLAFKIPKSNFALLSNEYENSVIGIDGDAVIEDITNNSNAVEGSDRKKKAVNKVELEILDIDIIRKVTRDESIDKKTHAPVCIFNKKQIRALNMILLVDSLALVNKKRRFAQIYEVLLECIIRHLRLYEDVLLSNLNVEEDNEAFTPETFHFYPADCGHFLTRIYLKNTPEDDLKIQRELLHKQLILQNNMPVFKRGNKYVFKNKNNILVNPHENLKVTDNDGHIALVKGKYKYYHYCQNKMDDNGWGCAYRSLQTLASWYKLQGYTSREVPDFKEIQSCLVRIGDKPSGFVGSKQWIGSTEVNFVLSELLGVTSKILYVSSGDDMASKGPELVNHFETQGSPVMIGGGVLAHTILGVDYNQQTGNVRFLILDPHYTGGEDLKVIQSKGWCGWKNEDFWDKTSYYNMCMPQVPREI